MQYANYFQASYMTCPILIGVIKECVSPRCDYNLVIIEAEFASHMFAYTYNGTCNNKKI